MNWPPPLDRRRRDRALADMSDRPLDVLVIGGGVVGCGAALDAATRGLRTGLVEARDYAAGTSSRSSKLIHGGLRYLEQLDLGLVAEALRERRLILTHLAPHLARPVPFIYPLRHRVWERVYVGSGLTLYDTMGGLHRDLPRHRHLSRTRALAEFPSLREDALVGGIRYVDGQVDDARHTMMLARTAVAHGALTATSARVVDLVRERGRVVGAAVEDLETGEVREVRARQTINAAGVWNDEIAQMSGATGGFPQVRASKGVHLVVPRQRIDGSAGIISRTPTSVLFIIPWDDVWLIGTTDTEWALDPAHPAASRQDIDYLLGQANALLREPLTAHDVLGVYAGLRPLLAGESDDTPRLSRIHAVTSPMPGLVMVAGGKYTTYRVMARDAVDRAAAGLPGPVPESCTEHVPLVGADGFVPLVRRQHQLAEESGLRLEDITRLLGRYGTLVNDVLDLVREDPALAAPMPGSPGHLAAEVRYAAVAEGALHLDDILTRRTRTSILTRDRGLAAAPEVAALVASDLGWSRVDESREVDVYRDRVRAELASQAMPDDVTAAAARGSATDSRSL